MRRSPSFALLTAALLSLPACGAPDLTQGGSGTDPAGTAEVQQPRSASAIQTVFLILLENHNWSSIKGSSSAPYLNNTLLPMAAHAENYRGPNGGTIHPSEPNYIWLEAGSNLGVSNDNDPAQNHQSVTDHLVTLLENNHLTWRSYQEDIPGGTCPLTGVKNYAPKHNPMVFFDDVINYHNGAGDPNAPRCVANVKPLTQLSTDLAANTVARYNFITPNQCDDMHTSCAPLNNTIKQGDTWLSQWIPQIMASAAYQSGGAIFITWDESEFALNCLLANCPIGMIVLSPLGKGGGYSNKIAYNHSSTLRTIQEILQVTPLLRHAGDPGVADLSDLFQTFP